MYHASRVVSVVWASLKFARARGKRVLADSGLHKTARALARES